MANSSGQIKKLKQGKFPTYRSHLSSSTASFSSSPSSSSDFEYDVFISFRGTDTRKTFTSHLYTSLDENGILTFMDDQELQTGEKISPGLLRAIETSMLYVVVLSKNYADSRWCLDELLHILNSVGPKNSVIPVFYDVDPSVVRNQSDSYAIAFAEHELKYKDQVDKITKWRSALTSVANLSGWHLSDQTQVKFIKDIVNDVYGKLGDTAVVLDELDATSQLLNTLKGTYPGFSGEKTNQFQLQKVEHSFKYDVFLSFRGMDTRHGFVSHLYNALTDHGIMAFQDEEILSSGMDTTTLFQAINNSKILVVILSLGYFSSKWCLDELVHILERRKIAGNVVIPIFYGVDPSDVRKQKGSCGKAFAEHENRFEGGIEKTKRWRAALREVGNLSGFLVGEGNELGLISEIVRLVLSRDLSVSVGREKRVDDLISQLDLDDSHNVRIVGIWGTAGIGKTTITEATCNWISNQFDVCCFLSNVKEDSKILGLVSLQQQLLDSLKKVANKLLHSLEREEKQLLEELGLFNKKISARDVQNGVDLIRRHFYSKRVLFVIDDVDKLDQLEALAGDPSWFGSGSRIIITTRDKNLLSSKRGVELYKIEALNNEESIQLFSLTAFGENKPKEDCKELCNHVIEYANGNPLTIKVIGRFLSDKNINEWVYSLDNLKSLPEAQIFDILCKSYDSLDPESKAIFLHIACFLEGKSVDRVSQVLNCCGYHSEYGLKLLIEKSFVTVSNNSLRMHHLAQKIGQEIVRQECISEPGKRSRLWHHKDIYDAMYRNSVTESVEAIVLNHPELEGHWTPTAFSRLCNLKMLSIRSNIHLPEGLECLPENLRLFKWRGYELEFLPPDFYPSELVEVNMCHSQIKQLCWEDKVFKNLKCINLSHSQNLIKTPDFTQAPNLEKLILDGCTSLVEVHPSFGTLRWLQLLNLKDCISLRSLSNDMSLESLQICILSGCSKLDHIDRFVASLLSCSPHLLKLSLNNCFLEIGVIPNDIGCCFLTSVLEVLDIGGNKFRSIPDSISQLSNLKFLGLAHCDVLESVPELPSSLQYVEARDCCSLHTLLNPIKVGTSLVLSFINCFKLALDQDCRSIAITWLKAYLRSLLQANQNEEQELSHQSGRFDIILPADGIPEWFRHQSMGPSVSIPFPPNSRMSNKDWIGFVFCVVFEFHHIYFEKKSSTSYEISCQLYLDDCPIGNSFGFCSKCRLVESGHLWLRYISNDSFGKRKLRRKRISHITASFRTDSQCLEVKKCGLRAVYKQDMEEMKKRKFHYICPPTDDFGVSFFSYDI